MPPQKQKHTYLRSHKISGSVVGHDLKPQVDEILARAVDARAGRAAKTLVKEGPLRVTLVAVRKGTSLNEHDVDGAISVQVLRGRVRFDAAERHLDLRAGHLVALDAGVRHIVTAAADSAILITMSME